MIAFDFKQSWGCFLLFHISLQMHRISSDEIVAVLYLSVKGTHHHALKLGVELLKLGGEFLPRREKRKKNTLSAAECIQPFCQDLDRDKTAFTSHVWLSLLTAGLLIPIMMAKNEFKFLNSRQLWAHTHTPVGLKSGARAQKESA